MKTILRKAILPATAVRMLGALRSSGRFFQEHVQPTLRAHQAKRALLIGVGNGGERLVQQLRGGRDYDAGYGQRMRGQGVYADLIAQRFRKACQRLGLNREGRFKLSTAHFRVPPAAGDQLSLL